MRKNHAIILSALCFATGLISFSEAEAQTSGRYCRDRTGRVYHRSSTPCPRGETEVPNPNGGGGPGSPAATVRDSFVGGTGTANFVSGTAYAVNEVNVSGAPGSLFAGTLNSCSQAEFRFDVSTAPGVGNSRVFSLRADNNAGPHSNPAACTITGAGTSCTGTANFVYSPGDSISVIAQDTAAPAATTARWAVRCTAQ